MDRPTAGIPAPELRELLPEIVNLVEQPIGVRRPHHAPFDGATGRTSCPAMNAL